MGIFHLLVAYHCLEILAHARYLVFVLLDDILFLKFSRFIRVVLLAKLWHILFGSQFDDIGWLLVNSSGNTFQRWRYLNTTVMVGNIRHFLSFFSF